MNLMANTDSNVLEPTIRALGQLSLEICITPFCKPQFYIGSTGPGKKFVNDQQVIDSGAVLIEANLAQ